MLSRFEIVKDTVQAAIESGAPRVGRIASLIAGAVRDVTREIGGWATDVFEAVDAARRADADRDRPRAAAPPAAKAGDAAGGPPTTH
jgi:hypothetical protein